VNTGQSDISKLGKINRFNGIDHHTVYKEKCSKLDGSTGELYPPDQTRDSINLFIADMCRSIPFDYEKDVQVHDVVGYRFTAGTRAIDNGTNYSDNLCYNDGNSDKFPSGVMNISACKYSVPIFMSYPHFFEADSFYLNGIEGLKPDKEMHQSYITLEPVSRNFAISNILIKKFYFRQLEHR
jgi:scavenger receptor class B protein 1